MTFPISTAVAGASLIGTLALGYATQLRPANVKIRLIEGPSVWTVAYQRPGVVPGTMFQAGRDDATILQMAGTCPATIENFGPKAGAIWNVLATAANLDGGWDVNPSILEVQPHPLLGNSCEGWPVTFALYCSVADTARALLALRSGSGAVVLRIEYRRHNLAHKVVRASTEVSVNRRSLVSAVACGARSAGVDLAWLEVRDEALGMIQQAMASLAVPDEQVLGLGAALAWALPPSTVVARIEENSDGPQIAIEDDKGHRFVTSGHGTVGEREAVLKQWEAIRARVGGKYESTGWPALCPRSMAPG